ncbi:MAG: ABC transporter permease [Bryobacteraceae bacterium]
MRQWRYAFRALVRRPAFTIGVLALLAVGIAVNTALFSVVETVVWKPLPYPDSERLVALYEASPAKDQKVSLIAPGRLEDWNRLNRTFTAIAGAYTENVTDTSGAEPVRLSGLRVSPRYFQVFQTNPILGRTFTPDEQRDGGPHAAVISYGVWAGRYGQDPRITSRRLIIGGQGFGIVGVMPMNFAGRAETAQSYGAGGVDVWIPAQTAPFLMGLRDARFYNGVGRVRPGVTIEQARADLTSVQHALGEQFPATDKGWSVMTRPLKQARLGDSAKPLFLLFGAVGLLLLITVTNVASLSLAQLHSRQRELAIRVSVGATRMQVVASVMREIAMLAAAGAAAGWAIAYVSMPLLARLFADLPRIGELRMDWRAALFAIAATVVAAVLFGLLPAVRATGMAIDGTLLRAGRSIAGRRQWMQRALVAAQIAVTMVLLAGAGLLARSFYNLTHVDLGFDPSHTLVFHVGAAWDEDRTRIGRMQQDLIGDLERIPGVQAAGMTNFLPAEGATLRYQVQLEGASTTENQGTMPIGERTVSPGYLKALRAPLAAGTWCPELAPFDRNAVSRVMVNRRFVDVYAHGQNVVGRHLRWVEYTNAQPEEIVGVIGDMKEDTVNAPAYPYVYSCAVGGAWPDPDYVVRTAGDPLTFIRAIRDVVHNAAPDRAIFGAETIDDALAADLERPRSNARLLGVFAISAMILAAVGLYGLMTQLVNARRREIGIRMAMGADPARLVGSVLGGAGKLVAVGVVAGCVLILAAQPALRSLVFGIGPLDGLSIAAAAALLAAVSALAAFVPARRAAAIDPIETLRAE